MANRRADIAAVADESERTRGMGDEVLLGAPATRPNRVKSQMLSLRLSQADFDRVERIAHKLDVPVSALVRGWILAGLEDHHTATVEATVERLAADVERLRQLVK